MNKKVIISIIAVVLVIAIICGGYFLRLHLFKSADNALADEKHSTIIEEELTTEAETEPSSNTGIQPLSDIDTISKY